MWINRDTYKCMKLRLEVKQDIIDYYKGLLDGYKDSSDFWRNEYEKAHKEVLYLQDIYSDI